VPPCRVRRARAAAVSSSSRSSSSSGGGGRAVAACRPLHLFCTLFFSAPPPLCTLLPSAPSTSCPISTYALAPSRPAPLPPLPALSTLHQPPLRPPSAPPSHTPYTFVAYSPRLLLIALFSAPSVALCGPLWPSAPSVALCGPLWPFVAPFAARGGAEGWASMGAASTAPAGPSLYDQRPHAVAAHLALRLRGRECRGKMLSRAEVGSLRRIGSRRPNGGTVQVGTLMFARRLRSPEARGPSALREGGRHLRVVQVRASVGAHAPCRCGARWGEPCLSCGSRAAVEGRSRRELYACRGGTPMASSGACAFVCGRQLGACVRCVVLPRDRRV